VTQSSFIGGLFFGFIQLINGVPFVTHPSKLNPMLKRGLYGGIANCCAYYAVSTLDLGVANCIMFTMPLWTAVLAYAKLDKTWGATDLVLAMSCMLGTVLVSELWVVWQNQEQLLGVIAAMVFAVVNADAVLMVNTELRGEHPLSMTVAIMAAGTALGAVATALEASFGVGGVKDTYSVDAPPAVLALSVALSFGMPLMLLFRNAGFALSKDTTVAQAR